MTRAVPAAGSSAASARRAGSDRSRNYDPRSRIVIHADRPRREQMRQDPHALQQRHQIARLGAPQAKRDHVLGRIAGIEWRRRAGGQCARSAASRRTAVLRLQRGAAGLEASSTRPSRCRASQRQSCTFGTGGAQSRAPGGTRRPRPRTRPAVSRQTPRFSCSAGLAGKCPRRRAARRSRRSDRGWRTASTPAAAHRRRPADRAEHFALQVDRLVQIAAGVAVARDLPQFVARRRVEVRDAVVRPADRSSARLQHDVGLGARADRQVLGLGAGRRSHRRHRRTGHHLLTRHHRGGATLSSRTSLNEPNFRPRMSAASSARPRNADNACLVASCRAFRSVCRRQTPAEIALRETHLLQIAHEFQHRLAVLAGQIEVLRRLPAFDAVGRRRGDAPDVVAAGGNRDARQSSSPRRSRPASSRSPASAHPGRSARPLRPAARRRVRRARPSRSRFPTAAESCRRPMPCHTRLAIPRTAFPRTAPPRQHQRRQRRAAHG